MLSQLQKAKILSNIAGFIFGCCTNCNNSNKSCPEGAGLNQTLTKYFKDLKVPAFAGSMIGHKDKVFTIPIGVLVEINASKGTIKMLEKAVK